MASRNCYAHPEVVARRFCSTCGRRICDVCAFETALGSTCPDCVLGDGGGHAQHRRSNRAAITSIVLAGTTVLAYSAALVLADDAASSEERDALSSLLGIVMLGSLGGLSAGFVGREQSKRLKSPLATIGIIANGVLLGLLTLLIIVGLGMD